MARLKVFAPPPDVSAPSVFLLRMRTDLSAAGYAAGFEEWLHQRAQWRLEHPTRPLPGLFSRDRHALHSLDLPPALVRAEEHAPTADSGGPSPRR